MIYMNNASQKLNFICKNYLTKVVCMKSINPEFLNYYIVLCTLQMKFKLKYICRAMVWLGKTQCCSYCRTIFSNMILPRHNVLLFIQLQIDCNLRHSIQHIFYFVPNRSGLPNYFYFSFQISLIQLYHRLIQTEV